MTLRINKERCVKCGLCTIHCQFGAFNGEGEHRVGQSLVYDSVVYDENACTDCGECTAYQFWCPAEAIYDDSTEKTDAGGTKVEEGDDGKKYSRFIYEYKHGDDPDNPTELNSEVNQGPIHTEKGYHQCLKPEQWDNPDLKRPAFADDKY